MTSPKELLRAKVQGLHLLQTRQEQPVCGESRAAIKAYAKPIYRLPMAVFRDEKYLVPGADLSVKITRALEDSEFLIYLASPQAAQSEWVCTELEQWCRDEQRRQRLIIVLTDGKIQADQDTKRVDSGPDRRAPTIAG